MTEPAYADHMVTIYQGDVLDRLRDLADESVQCVVTSPPYWGLRDYGTAEWNGGAVGCEHGVRRWEGVKQTQGAMSGHAAKGDRLDRAECPCGAIRVDAQIGLESTPEGYVAALVSVFAELRRVLRKDGTLWLNLGDCYATSINGTRHEATKDRSGQAEDWRHSIADTTHQPDDRAFRNKPFDTVGNGLKPKDLVGMPWRVALALRADGWYLRRDIIWHKPNPMPESVTDRPTTAHEYLFLLTKSATYYYDHVAIREPDAGTDHPRKILDGQASLEPSGGLLGVHSGIRTTEGRNGEGRNKRSVWTIATRPYLEAHFATFPEALVEPCVLAGTRPGDTVLDPFAGSGTTLAVAKRLDRRGVGIELNPDYCDLAARRIKAEGAQMQLPTETRA